VWQSVYVLFPELVEGVPRLSPHKALPKPTDDDYFMKLDRTQVYRLVNVYLESNSLTANDADSYSAFVWLIHFPRKVSAVFTETKCPHVVKYREEYA